MADCSDILDPQSTSDAASLGVCGGGQKAHAASNTCTIATLEFVIETLSEYQDPCTEYNVKCHFRISPHEIHDLQRTVFFFYETASGKTLVLLSLETECCARRLTVGLATYALRMSIWADGNERAGDKPSCSWEREQRLRVCVCGGGGAVSKFNSSLGLMVRCHYKYIN